MKQQAIFHKLILPIRSGRGARPYRFDATLPSGCSAALGYYFAFEDQRNGTARGV